jgi:hypothetical protein
MRYSIAADLAAGVTRVSANRVDLGRGSFGSGCWVNPSTFLANAAKSETVDEFHLYAYRRQFDGQFLRQETPWDTRGSTTAGGGSDNWMVTVQSTPKQTYGVVSGRPYDSAQPTFAPDGTFEEDRLPDGTLLAEVNVLDGGEDGRLIFTSPDFQSLGILTPDGKSIHWWATGPHVNLSTVRVISGGFVYMDGAQLMLQMDLEPPRPVHTFDNAFDPDSFVYQGQRWFFYHNELTYLHPEGSDLGYMFEGSYGPAVWVGLSGECHVALSTSPGEIATSITLVPPFTLGQGMVPIKKPIVYPVVRSFEGRKFRLGPFKDLDGVSGSDSEVVIDGNAQVAVRPCWVGQGPDILWTSVDRAYSQGRLLGIVAEGPTVGPARAKADALKTRVAWWKDGPDPVPIPIKELNPWDQIWGEWYVFKEHGETLQKAMVRWQRELDLSLATHCQDLAGIPQYFNRFLFSDQEMVDLIYATLEWFRQLDPRVSGFYPFEFNRLNGITGVVPIHEMYSRTLNAWWRVPEFVPAWPTPPPTRMDDFLLYEMIARRPR